VNAVGDLEVVGTRDDTAYLKYSINELKKRSKYQGCRNPGRQASLANAFVKVVPNVCGSAVWNLLIVIFLAPILLGWHVGFLENTQNPC